MYRFIGTTTSEAATVAKQGLRLDPETRRRFRESLDDVSDDRPERILVVPAGRVDAILGASPGPSPRLGNSDIVNLNPYRPPRPVQAGGGFVMRSGSTEPEILLIYRRGKWDLPKGKRDPGESIEECALREVREELGISDVDVLAPLGSTVHGYEEASVFRVKTTYWFLMQTSETHFSPEKEEDIEEVAWRPYPDALSAIGYETLHDHMKHVRDLAFDRLKG